METEYCEVSTNYGNENLEYSINNAPSLISSEEEHTDDEIDIFTMTSLGTLMLVGQTRKDVDENNLDEDIQRLSLAYEKIRIMPKILVQELSPLVKILDVSYNEFESLDFLKEFKELTSLICDHNKITSHTVIPYLPKLELLWMNHCKINELYPWARRLQQSCPNLKILSLMGNPISPSNLNGGTLYEYLQYRLFIISLFPNLIHLDDKSVTSDEVIEARKMYQRPLVERLVTKTQQSMPNYLRAVSEKVSDLVWTAPPFYKEEKNCIV